MFNNSGTKKKKYTFAIHKKLSITTKTCNKITIIVKVIAMMMLVMRMLVTPKCPPTWQSFIVEKNVHLLHARFQWDELYQVDTHILRFHLVGNVPIVDHDLQLSLSCCMHIN